MVVLVGNVHYSSAELVVLLDVTMKLVKGNHNNVF